MFAVKIMWYNATKASPRRQSKLLKKIYSFRNIFKLREKCVEHLTSKSKLFILLVFLFLPPRAWWLLCCYEFCTKCSSSFASRCIHKLTHLAKQVSQREPRVTGSYSYDVFIKKFEAKFGLNTWVVPRKVNQQKVSSCPVSNQENWMCILILN